MTRYLKCYNFIVEYKKACVLNQEFWVAGELRDMERKYFLKMSVSNRSSGSPQYDFTKEKEHYFKYDDFIKDLNSIPFSKKMRREINFILLNDELNG